MKVNATTGEERARAVQDMFRRIAPHYDLMNRLMTGGQDVIWRKEVIRRAAVPAGGRLLDLGAGTGDLAREALRQGKDVRPVAADFTLKMMLAGKHQSGRMPAWSGADALNLPFPDNTFDAVVSGFLLRNVVDLPRALQEQYRVLKPGGRWVALDTTPPPGRSLLGPFIRFHMRVVIPSLGSLLTGSREAYVYLPQTSERFLPAEKLLALVNAAGFYQTGFERKLFSVVAIHWGSKPFEPGRGV